MSRTALITGITGQDGAYLAELLLSKGYVVHSITRRASLSNTGRIDHLRTDLSDADGRLILHHGDMTDASNLIRVVQQTQPDEIYNLGAQSDVQASFETPEYTANANALGTLRLLEAIQTLGLTARTRFYQASTSEMYGQAHIAPQSETTRFDPRSPYATSKLFAHNITVNYRQSYGLHACNGILFNHESPVRGESFVTRKISRGVAAISLGLQERILLGNLDAERDWGHARDYVEGIWRIVQHPTADDYVLATGRKHSVRQFAERAFAETGITIEWHGEGLHEHGVDCATGQVLVEVDPRYFRPNEVDTLVGDASKARNVLGWSATTSFEQLVRDMVKFDLVSVAVDAERPAFEQRQLHVAAQ